MILRLIHKHNSAHYSLDIQKLGTKLNKISWWVLSVGDLMNFAKSLLLEIVI